MRVRISFIGTVTFCSLSERPVLRTSHTRAMPAWAPWLMGFAVALLTPACGSPDHVTIPGSAGASSACARISGTDYRAGAYVQAPARRPRHPALVVAFHYLGGTGRDLAATVNLDTLAEREGFVAAYPDARSGKRWQLNHADGDSDVRGTARLIAALERRLCVDPRRVYLTGVSNGAGFAARAACQLASRVAAVVPIAGSFKALDPCPRRGPEVPLLEIHGERDQFLRTVPRLLSWWLPRDKCGSPPRVTRPWPGVRRTRWPGCDVERVFLAKTGHGWPGSFVLGGSDPTGFDASDALWRFVRDKRR
jgi:polyhydroxybutyrate depolymerase